MAGYVGNYTRGGNPEAMYSEDKLYLEMLAQAALPAIDSDFNDMAFSRVRQLRRIIQNTIGDGAPNNGFKIAQSTIATSNNFKITGGDGTDDGAGRIYIKGFPCFLKADVDYSGAYNALMTKVLPEVTGVTSSILTDSSANWVVNEHTGKTLTPDITVPGTTFTVASNTANTITVTSGDLTTATASRKFYRIELTTPGGTQRLDEVYLDVFIDEQDSIEDQNLVNMDLSPPTAGALRIILRQFIRVVEGGTTPAPWIDSDGRPHYPLKIASITRPASTAAILTGQLTDYRPTFTPGQAKLRVQATNGVPTILSVSQIQVPPGSLTDLGGGIAELDVGSGSTKGQTARAILFSNDISGINPPATGTLGTDIDTLDHPHGSTTGQRVEFTVPLDYDSGPLQIDVIYAMSTAVASPNNVIRLQTLAQLALLTSGTLDTSTYPATASNLSVSPTTNLFRVPVMTLTDSTFRGGDRIAVEIRRLGADGNDLHTGNWRIVSYQAVYLAQIATRAVVQSTDLLDDTAAGLPTTPGVLGTDIQTEDYVSGTDAEQKCTFIVPDSWDGVSDANVRLDYAMSTAVSGGDVRLVFGGQIAHIGTGAVVTLGAVTFDLLPPNDTNPHRTVVLFSIPASSLTKGDHVTLKIKRTNAGVPSNHTGNFKLINVTFVQGQAPSSAFTAVRIIEQYMSNPSFGSRTGTLTIDTGAFPSFGGDFESYTTFAGGASGGAVPLAFEGRLASDGSSIDTISVNIKGSGTAKYQLQVYVEGQGASPVYDTGTLISAPSTQTTISIAAINLTAQPSSGLKRFFLVVTVTLAASDTLSVSKPYVRQE